MFWKIQLKNKYNNNIAIKVHEVLHYLVKARILVDHVPLKWSFSFVDFLYHGQYESTGFSKCIMNEAD